MEDSGAPRGLIVELITPMTDEGEIDTASLKKYLNRVMPYAQGLFLASPMAGEGLLLPLKQRRKLLLESLEITEGRMPLMVWISGREEEETRNILFSLHSTVEGRDLHAPLFWVDAPLTYHSNRGLPDLYKDYAAMTDRHFILMNDPSLVHSSKRPFKRKNIRTAILKELTYIPSVSGLIFLGELDRAYNYQKAARARSRFRIYDGDEARFLDYPSLSGVVSVGANLRPRQWHTVTSSSLHLGGYGQDYPDSLRQIWYMGQQLHRLREAYSPNPAHLIKVALKEMGVLESAFTLERTPEGQEVEELLDLLREYKDEEG